MAKRPAQSSQPASDGGGNSLLYCPPPTAIPDPCPTDVNGDGVTNVLDLVQILLCFGDPATPPCDTGTDINQDGVTNVLDLIQLLLAFGTGC